MRALLLFIILIVSLHALTQKNIRLSSPDKQIVFLFHLT